MEAEGDVATAVTLARILSNIPLSRGGPTSVVIFDIHALQVQPSFLWHMSGMSALEISYTIIACTCRQEDRKKYTLQLLVVECVEESLQVSEHMKMGMSEFW